MDYLILAAIALCIGLMGFFLHAIFFSKKKMIRNLLESNGALREDLRRKESEILDMREKMVRSKKHIDLLERQLRQKNLELNELYQGTLRREEKMALLERTIEKNYPEGRETKEYPSIFPTSNHMYSSDDDSRAGVGVTRGDFMNLKGNGGFSGCDEEPLWLKKLNTILNILNEIEK